MNDKDVLRQRVLELEGRLKSAGLPVSGKWQPEKAVTCVRCDVDLTVPPHVKRCWAGTPRALNAADPAGSKGDLCDPCHELWKQEKEAAEVAEVKEWVERP